MDDGANIDTSLVGTGPISCTTTAATTSTSTSTASTKQQGQRKVFVDDVTTNCHVVLYENVICEKESHQLLNELSASLPWKVEVDNFGSQSRPTCYYADTIDCVFSYVGLRLIPNLWTAVPVLRELRDTVTKTCQLSDPCFSTTSIYSIQSTELPSSAGTTETTTTTTTSSRYDNHPISSSSSSSAASSLSAPKKSLLTACLINHYPAGEGYIPWHYDEVRAHGPTKTVASLSLGGPRRFQLRTRANATAIPPPPPAAAATNSDVDSSTSDVSTTGRMIADILLPSGSVLVMQGNTQDYYEHCIVLANEGGGNDESNSNKKDQQGKQQQQQTTNESSLNPHRISLTFRSIVPGYESNREIAIDECTTENLE